MKMKRYVIAVAAVLGLFLAGNANDALAGKPTIAGGCKKCHQASTEAVRGKLAVVSSEFQTMQVAVGKLIWIVKYDNNTNVRNGERLGTFDELTKVPKNKEILVTYTGTPSDPLATEVAIKQPYKVSAEQLMTYEELHELVESNSGKEQYALIDSRPGGAYLAGHIPHAKSLPFGAFEEKHQSVLPSDKDTLLIFYCGGFT